MGAHPLTPYHPGVAGSGPVALQATGRAQG